MPELEFWWKLDREKLDWWKYAMLKLEGGLWDVALQSRKCHEKSGIASRNF